MTTTFTFSPAAGPPRRVYQVLSAGVHVGLVQRFGSLPSCQRWAGRDARTGQWTRSRDTRAQAGADVLAAWQQAGDQP